MNRAPVRACGAFALACVLLGCPRTPTPRDAGPSAADRADAARIARERAELARIDRDFPQHGLVKGRQITIFAGPDRASQELGWLRRGQRIRVARERQRGPGCTEGWFAMHPRGLVCAGTDVLIAETPPEPEWRGTSTAVEAPMPYDYFFVTAYTSVYFRPPEPAEWRASIDYVGRYRHFAEEEPERLADFREGKIRGEPAKPPVMFEVLSRGYMIASPHEDSREGRDYVKTVMGRYVALGHLSPRRGSAFHGFELGSGEHTLPFAVVNRPTPLERAVDRGRDGIRFVDDDTQRMARYELLGDRWKGRIRLGDYNVHRVGEDRYLKEWYVSVLDRVTPDFEVANDEVWIHVDLSEQTLLVYRGTTPFYGTLVSTGMPGHETPRGHFRIQRKFVGSTMDDLGPEVGGDDYRIEDVPYTQYFRDSVALHGAFWHDRFGVARSHGCVNLAPTDAFRIFQLTRPTVPPGWHGVPTNTSGEQGTRVWVTP